MTKLECNLPAVIEELQNKAAQLDAKDIELQNQINNEVTNRTNADAQLQANINSEAAARASADQNLQNQIDALNIAGTVQYFSRLTAPEGWLKADGSSVSRTEYADLYAAVGTMFGEGDGSTTFNLPDLRGEFLRGFDNGRGIDLGRTLGSAQIDAFQGHWHEQYYYSIVRSGLNDAYVGIVTSGNNNNGSVPDSVKHAISDGTHGNSRIASETRPRNVALLACIKY